MLSELANRRVVTGLTQTIRAVEKGAAEEVYIAEDAETRLRLELLKVCDRGGVTVHPAGSMAELGRACGIKIGASSAAVLKNGFDGQSPVQIKAKQ